MFHWIADSRNGFVVVLMAAFLVAMAIYALPALLAWSMGSPQRVAIHSGGSAAGLDHHRLDCRPDLGDHVWKWREF